MPESDDHRPARPARPAVPPFRGPAPDRPQSEERRPLAPRAGLSRLPPFLVPRSTPTGGTGAPPQDAGVEGPPQAAARPSGDTAGETAAAPEEVSSARGQSALAETADPYPGAEGRDEEAGTAGAGEAEEYSAGPRSEPGQSAGVGGAEDTLAHVPEAADAGTYRAGTQGADAYRRGAEHAATYTSGAEDAGTYTPEADGTSAYTPGAEEEAAYTQRAEEPGAETPDVQGAVAYPPEVQDTRAGPEVQDAMAVPEAQEGGAVSSGMEEAPTTDLWQDAGAGQPDGDRNGGAATPRSGSDDDAADPGAYHRDTIDSGFGSSSISGGYGSEAVLDWGEHAPGSGSSATNEGSAQFTGTAPSGDSPMQGATDVDRDAVEQVDAAFAATGTTGGYPEGGEQVGVPEDSTSAAGTLPLEDDAGVTVRPLTLEDAPALADTDTWPSSGQQAGASETATSAHPAAQGVEFAAARAQQPAAAYVPAPGAETGYGAAAADPAGEQVAAALEWVAHRIRRGELRVPLMGAEGSQAAALAAALAAVLGLRRD